LNFEIELKHFQGFLKHTLNPVYHCHVNTPHLSHCVFSCSTEHSQVNGPREPSEMQHSHNESKPTLTQAGA